jgi:TolB-like protein/tetratricopeptide (TPR) repeat protein
MRLIAELKRRKVIRTAVIYAAAAWLLLQVAELLLDMLAVPAWGLRLVFVLLVIGFPLALVLSWMHQITPEGIRREVDLPPAPAAPAATDRAGAEPTPDRAAPAPILPTAQDPSIAVLPFVNMSEDPANLHFADGLSEELLNLLSRTPGLRVVARTSSFAFRGRPVSATAIAQELRVAHLLEGSVRRSGNRIRITAQLVRGSDSSHVWSRSYDRDLTDIFAVQDEIAAAVVDELQVKLLGEGAPRSWPTDPVAYAHFLRARQHADLASKEGHERAIAELEAALGVDPRFGPAWATLGVLYFAGANNSLVDYDEGARRAREYSEKALALSPDLAEPLSLLGYLDVLEGVDFDGGMRRLERARQLEPHNPRVLIRIANIAIRNGRLDDALRNCRQALRSDPLSALAHAVYGNACYYDGRYEEAEALRRKVLALSPGWLSGHYHVGKVLLARGDAAGALEEVQREPSEFWRLTGLAIVHHALGRPADSDSALARLEAMTGSGTAYQLAQIHAFRGEIDAAFQCLERAGATHDAGMIFTHVDPLLANLRGDSRYGRFLARYGLPGGG